jgi:hypothetical protein
LLGYVPRYYCEGIIKWMVNGAKCNCTVLEIKKDKNCQECVYVRLELSYSKNI